ncbi:MAG: PAS domain-containing protein [Gemmatimonadota bacterium]
MPIFPSEQDYLRALFETLHFGVLIADDRATYVDANQLACRLFDRERSGIVGHHLSEFIPGARTEEVQIQWDAFLRDGVQDGLFTIHLPDGSTRHLQFHAQANFVPGLHCSFLTAVDDPGTAAKPLDALLTLCAWTKRVQVEGTWISIEEYLARVHHVAVTHGISPDAFSEFMGSADTWKRKLD